MNKKVILLSRVSTEVQHLESQTNDLIREAERLGYSKENQIIIESKEYAIKLAEDDYNKIQVQINELQQSLHNQQISTTEIVNYDNVTNFQTKLEMVHKYLKDVVLYKSDEDKTLTIEFNWKLNLIIPRSKYKYIAKGGNPKIYRINEDGTIDLIYRKR